MKTISLHQWRSMNAKKRSWIVCRSRGYKCRVFWHHHAPDGRTIAGSYDSLSYCQALTDCAKEMLQDYVRFRRRDSLTALARWVKKYPTQELDRVRAFAEAQIRCTASFPLYLENDHSAPELLIDLQQQGFSVSLCLCAEGVTAQAKSPSGEDFTTFEFDQPYCRTVAEAACLLYLFTKGLIQV